MKKFLIALFTVCALALAPVAQANHMDGVCYPIETAKSDVRKWAKEDVWVYQKGVGVEYEAVTKWLVTQNKSIPKIDGLLITYVTNKEDVKTVAFALSPDGVCVEMSTFHLVSPEQFATIVGRAV